MGGAVSTGVNNNDLIDNLLEANYIRTADVERAFRNVDRAAYFLPDAKKEAYKDLAWKSSNLHLSAPCIYSEVMEGLCLKPGLSFLNLGSGTGYLNTMAGLILGKRGINHGIEIYQDVVQYAYEKLEEFKLNSGAVDEFDFCEPKFFKGNCLCLNPERRLYDRVYCGAACPTRYENYIQHFLNIGGILVMPVNDTLKKIKRISENSWESRKILPVSFATLIPPVEGKTETVELIEYEPPSLQSLCRSLIRTSLRKNIEVENPELKTPRIKKKQTSKKRRSLRRLVVPFFDSSDDSEVEFFELPHVLRSRNHDTGRVGFERHDGENRERFNVREVSTLMDFVLRRQNATSRENADSRISDSEDDQNEAVACETEQNRSKDVTSEKETPPIDLEINTKTSKNEEPFDVEDRNTNGKTRPTEESGETSQCSSQPSPSLDDEMKRRNELVSNINNMMMDIIDCVQESLSTDGLGIVDDAEQTQNGDGESSTVLRKWYSGREKFDSGLGDEDGDKISTTSELSDTDNDMESCSSGNENGEKEKPKKRTLTSIFAKAGRKLRKLETRSDAEENNQDEDRNKEQCDENEEEEQQEENLEGLHVVLSPYTPFMKSRIQSLPLPQILKNYLNFYRSF